MKSLLARFNALASRERLLVILAVVGVLYFAFDAALLGPQLKRQKAANAQLTQLEGDLTAARANMVVVKAELEKDPHAKDRAQLDAYKKAMDDVDAFLARVQSDPRQVRTLLRQILASTPGLTLVSLKTLPAVAVTDAKGAEKAADSRTVYRRGIEVTVKGNYLAMLPYVDKLQNLPTRVLWSEADLGVGVYPESTLKLVIFTLSSEPEAALG